jgi:hypothetical protein
MSSREQGAGSLELQLVPTPASFQRRRESSIIGTQELVAPRAHIAQTFLSAKLRNRLRISYIAFLTFIIWMPVSAGASELVWRSDRAATTQPTTQTSLRPTAKPSSTTNTTSAIRFVRSSSQHVDSSLRQAAFEDDAPQLTSARDGDIHTRSLVINRDEATDSVRSAQLPPTGTGAGSTATPGSGSTSPPANGSPFGDMPTEPPQNQTPQLEQPTLPETNVPLPVPPTNNNTLQIDQQQPRPGTQPPAQNPPVQQPTTAPPNNPLQPILPSGPTPPEGTGPPAPNTPTATIEAERGKAKESCDKSLENLRAYTVDKVKLNIGVTGTEGKDYPFECSIDDGQQFKGRCWDSTTYLWKASALCHKPLYFEDEQLERYGHSWSPAFQPFISGAHFFCELPVLPYCMGVEPPCECIYALGYYRPGSCAPYMCEPVPLSLRGAVFEAGAVTGAAAILP